MAEGEAEPRVLIRVHAYDDGTGTLEVATDVSDDAAAAYLLHLAEIAERGEHRSPPDPTT